LSYGSTWSNRNAVLIYEVAPPTRTYRAASAIKGLTFSPDGRRMAAQANVWDVDERHGQLLHPATLLADAQADFLASGRSMWSVEKHKELKPFEPIKLRQVFPENREVI